MNNNITEKELYEKFRQQQMEFNKRMKRARLLAFSMLVYISVLVIAFVVSLFVPAFRESARIIFVAGNCISLGLVVWSVLRLRKFRLDNDKHMVYIYCVSVFAILINIFCIYNNFFPFF